VCKAIESKVEVKLKMAPLPSSNAVDTFIREWNITGLLFSRNQTVHNLLIRNVVNPS